MHLLSYVGFGDKFIRVLINHFSTVLLSHTVSTEDIMSEWVLLKASLYQRLPYFAMLYILYIYISNYNICNFKINRYSVDHLRTTLTWKDINSVLFSSCPLILSVIDLVLSIPATSIECERGFSTMRQVKNDWRSRLSITSLNDSMRILLEGPAIDQFQPEDAINKWFNAGVRSRRPYTKPLVDSGIMDIVTDLHQTEEDSDEDDLFQINDHL